MSGAEGASSGVTSAAEARLQQNSLRQTRRQQTRLRHKNSSQPGTEEQVKHSFLLYAPLLAIRSGSVYRRVPR
jgi:hypothetical protein